MAEKDQNSTIAGNLGELTTIRNILMGQQMTEYASRFDEIDQKLKALEAALEQKMEGMRLSLQDQISENLKTLETETTALKDQMATREQHLRSQLGNLLIELGEQMKKG
ncbi:MAG: hypothetical protein KDC44_20280 [Phaeodactylibacter sp.]|nr:hypothetical protein [Phaeodactylibacter sp.]